MAAVKTASRFNSRDALDAGVRSSPNIKRTGAAIPPKTTAPVRNGISDE